MNFFEYEYFPHIVSLISLFVSICAVFYNWWTSRMHIFVETTSCYMYPEYFEFYGCVVNKSASPISIYKLVAKTRGKSLEFIEYRDAAAYGTCPIKAVGEMTCRHPINL